MDQQTVENELLAIWASLGLPEIVNPADLNNALLICLRQFPRLCEMEINAGKEWHTKLLELDSCTENKSQLDKAKHATTEYYIYSLISKNVDRLADHKTGLQSKLKNVGRELQDSGQQKGY